jgi:hypothetical protein
MVYNGTFYRATKSFKSGILLLLSLYFSNYYDTWDLPSLFKKSFWLPPQMKFLICLILVHLAFGCTDIWFVLYFFVASSMLLSYSKVAMSLFEIENFTFLIKQIFSKIKIKVQHIILNIFLSPIQIWFHFEMIEFLGWVSRTSNSVFPRIYR